MLSNLSISQCGQSYLFAEFQNQRPPTGLVQYLLSVAKRVTRCRLRRRAIRWGILHRRPRIQDRRLLPYHLHAFASVRQNKGCADLERLRDISPQTLQEALQPLL